MNYTNPTVKLNLNQNPAYHNFSELGFPQLALNLTGHFSQDLFQWKEKIHQLCAKSSEDFNILGLDYGLLFEEGLLKVPVFFTKNQQTCALFFIYREQDARRFKDARKKLSNFGIRQVFYLSKIDLKQIKCKESALRVFGFKDMTWQETLGPGTYQTWWSTPNDPNFDASKSKQYLLRIKKSLQGYLKHTLQYLFTEVKVPNYQPNTLISIHEQKQSLFLKGPENQDILLTYSSQNGIEFHFPKGRVSRTYREFFLDQIHTSIQSYRLRLSLKAMPKKSSIIMH